MKNKKEAEVDLRHGEEARHPLARVSTVGVFLTDPKGLCIYVNEKWCELTGISSEEASGIGWSRAIHPDDRERVTTAWYRFASKNGSFAMAFRFQSPEGKSTWVRCQAEAERDSEGEILTYVGTVTDITDLMRIQQALETSNARLRQAESESRRALAEKEHLLKEIHHRVKNNLQMASSLLQLQVNKVQETQVRTMLEESQYRLRSMALVHEQLHQSEDLGRIHLEEYIETLTNHLMNAHLPESERVVLKTDLDKVTLGIDTAIPCGLIINELLSNSLKHAFPGDRTGEMCITCQLSEDNEIQLDISDNGIGFPKGFDFRDSESLGLELVNLFVKQLNGEIVLNTCQGTSFSIRFKEKRRDEDVIS